MLQIRVFVTETLIRINSIVTFQELSSLQPIDASRIGAVQVQKVKVTPEKMAPGRFYARLRCRRTGLAKRL